MTVLMRLFCTAFFIMSFSFHANADQIQFKNELVKIIKNQMAEAQGISAEQVVIEDFLIGMWGVKFEPLFDDRFFTEAYEFYAAPLPNEASTLSFFQRIQDKMASYKPGYMSHRVLYTALFAFRLRSEYLKEPIFNSELIKLLGFGEGYFNMGHSCPGHGDCEWVENNVEIIRSSTVAAQWEYVWKDPSRKALSEFVKITRTYQVGVHSNVRWSMQSHIIQLVNNLDPAAQKSLLEITNLLTDYLTEPCETDPFQTGFTLQFLNILKADSLLLRSRLFAYLSCSHFEIIENASDTLASLPHVSNATVSQILRRFLKPDLWARTLFHLLENTLFLLAENSPEQGQKIFNFFLVENPHILNEHKSVEFKILLALGFAGVKSTGFMNHVRTVAQNSSNYASQNAAHAVLGYQVQGPQKKEYHLALVSSFYSPQGWVGRKSKEALSFHYSSNLEFMSLLKDHTKIHSQRLNEIIEESFSVDRMSVN